MDDSEQPTATGSRPTRQLPGAAARTGLPGRTLALVGAAAIVGVLLVVWLLRPGPPGELTSTPSAAPTSSAPASAADRPPIAPVDACRLLELDEIDAAMGLLDLPLSDRDMIQRGGGEACTWNNSRDGVDVPGLSVRIEPGAVDDFEPGALLGGVSGEPVSGVGRLAVWFPGDRTGTLSVTAESNLGQLFFRVTVARPDLEAAAILPHAQDLATAALPRFPGIEAAVEEPVIVVIEHEPIDQSMAGYVDNLLAREAAGEWSRGAGLVATLQLFLGEADATEVLRHGEVLDESGGGIVELAREYLETGSDAAAREEIARLLGRIVFTREQLESMTGASSFGAVLAAFRAPPAGGGPIAQDDPCAEMGALPPCLLELVLRELATLETRYGPDKFRVYVWSNFEEFGWTDTHLRWIGQALLRSADTYAPLGSLPNIDVVVTPLSGPPIIEYGDAVSCFVNVNPAMQYLPEGQFKQSIAGHLALCFTGATFPAQAQKESARWWRDGLAVYLSNVAYPSPRCAGERCDLEWQDLPGLLAAAELGNTILDRSSSNAFFFQHLSWYEGDRGIVDLISRLQGGGGRAADEAVLASDEAMPQRFHEYVKNLSDARVQDTGGGFGPYSPPADEVPLTGRMIVLEAPVPFGTTRLHLLVDDGKKACIETTTVGDVQLSWRRGAPGAGGVASVWLGEPPRELERDAVVVITATTEGADVTLDVEVVDADEDCEREPTVEPEPVECPPIVCEPSNYYQFLRSIPPWFRDLLGG